MNSVKVAYIWASCVGQMCVLAAAVLIPIYLTPGSYWWTAFFLLTALTDGYALAKRMNLWTGEI